MKARSLQVWLLCGARLLCQANRLSIGGLLPLLAGDMALSTHARGQLLSAFPLGYMLTQVLGGAASDKAGGKPVMTLALFSIGFGSMALSVCEDPSAVWAILFLMGVLEGPSFPAGGVILAKWVPADERSTASAINDVGGPVGALVALFVTPVAAAALGWRTVCAVLGTTTLLLATTWQAIAAGDPSSCKYIRKAEIAELRAAGLIKDFTPSASGKQAAAEHGTPWRMLAQPAVWSVFVGHIAFNYCRYLLYNWIVTFYTDGLGVPLSEAGLCMLWPNVADGIASLLVGRAADALVSSGTASTRTVRRVSSTVGFLGTGIGAVMMGGAGSRLAATGWLTVACASQGFHNAGFKPSYADLSNEHGGFLRGVGNTFGTASSFVVPLAVSTLLERGGGQATRAAWQAVFGSVLAVAAAGAAFYGTTITTACLDAEVARAHSCRGAVAGEERDKKAQ